LFLICLGLVLFLFITWLSARFKFIWLNSILNNVTLIREPFKQFKAQGNSLFKLTLALYFGFILFLGLLLGWVGLCFFFSGALNQGFQLSFGFILKAFILPLIVFVPGIFAFFILSFSIKHFILAIMFKEKLTFLHAWPKFLKIFKLNFKNFLLYFLISFGLSILALIFVFAILMLLLLLAGICAALVFGLGYLLIVSLLKLKIIYIIYSLIIGIPFFILLILIFISMNLPVAVFFRVFPLYFLSELGCGCDFFDLGVGDESNKDSQ